MTPLVFLLVSFLLALAITAARDARRRPDVARSLRVGIGVMFLVTGVTHFVGMREQMIAMIPPVLPLPELIVTATGVLEIIAAIAMLSRRLWPWAALGLTVLLVAMFPANVYHALTADDLAWSSTLVPRTIIQAIYLTATASLAIIGFRRRKMEAWATPKSGARAASI